jgi:molybdopterin-guanine dinucleotide biosynthesis protein B
MALSPSQIFHESIKPTSIMEPKNIPPIVTIVANPGSGKTTLLEKLIPELKRRGYRVGTVKHHLHDFSVDKEGKDSWRHARAGADTVIIASPDKLAMIKKTNADMPLDTMANRLLYDVDIVLAEGYKTDKQLKVEVFRASVHAQPLFQNDPALLAMVTDSDVETGGVPHFGVDDIVPLADYLEQTCFRNRAHLK